MKKILLIVLGLFSLLVIVSILIVMFMSEVPVGDRVALIRIDGLITDSKETIDELKKYTKDPSVKAIVLRINSPGGAVAPAQEIYEEVKKAAAKKKVLVSMGAVAASGGYYIASPSTKIIANAGTLTGSIGVIMEIPNIEGLLHKLGIKTEVVKTGKYKDIASIFRGIKKENREILQGVLDNIHEQFIKAVAEGRNMRIEEVKKIADGRVFTGEQALKVGLIDEIGNLEDTIEAAAKLAGIKGEPVVISKKERLTITDLLRGNIAKEITEMFYTLKVQYLFIP
ncbi:MAG: signal peptide peptidase SppA [Nitrospira sp.]|nr:signal peptide peptidase SppA [Nitrospira sp.]